MNFKDLLGPFGGKAGATSNMKNLIEMAAADGQFLNSERELLNKIANRYGISESHLANIQNQPTRAHFEAPRDQKQKFHHLYDLVSVMGTDNQVQHQKSALADYLAEKLGYRREIAHELVETIRENIKNGSNEDETMKRAQMMIDR